MKNGLRKMMKTNSIPGASLPQNGIRNVTE